MAKRTAGRLLPVQADPSVPQVDVADRAQDGSGGEGGGAGLDEGAGGESGARSGSDPEDSEPDPQAQQSELCGVQATAVERSGDRMFRVGVRVEVLWKGKWNGWFAGFVTGFNAERGEYRVEYDDGKHDWHGAEQMRSAPAKARWMLLSLGRITREEGVPLSIGQMQRRLVQPLQGAQLGLVWQTRCGLP